MAGLIIRHLSDFLTSQLCLGPGGLSLFPSTSLWYLLAGNVHVLVNEMRGRRTASLPELKDCLGKAFL